MKKRKTKRIWREGAIKDKKGRNKGRGNKDKKSVAWDEGTTGNKKEIKHWKTKMSETEEDDYKR